MSVAAAVACSGCYCQEGTFEKSIREQILAASAGLAAMTT